MSDDFTRTNDEIADAIWGTATDEHGYRGTKQRAAYLAMKARAEAAEAEVVQLRSLLSNARYWIPAHTQEDRDLRDCIDAALAAKEPTSG